MQPSGTITFLFTDIEGSTRLWEQYPDLMGAALAGHDKIMEAAIREYGGQVVKKRGDGYHAAFGTPQEAVSACIRAQQGISAEAWEGLLSPIKVRMSLHTAAAKEREGDYYGTQLNRAARLQAAAHGGQVLISAATRELLLDEMPQDAYLLDMGEHRLKDLSRPEHIYQLCTPGLPRDFPPILSLDALRSNLPALSTSFVGRDHELTEISRLLANPDCRLLTLTGPGGVGKTRLALETAAQQLGNYPDGVFFVPLTAVNSSDYLPQSIGEALKFNFDTHSSDRSPKSQLLEYLEKRSILLVLDNFEHLMSGAELLGELLDGTSQLNLLVTSRERLKLKGEWIYEVQGMSYPTNGSNAGLENFSAVRLFLERARQVHSYAVLTEEEKPCVKRICQLVQGMPLGIELAAGWLPVLSCREIAEEIETNLDFLTSTQRDQPDKHRSLRAAFEYSWKLLDDEHKRVFRGLSIFRGGFDRKAAQRVLGANLLTLSDLVDKSLLHRTEQGRYEIHELLRQFGREYLASHQEEAQVRENHSRYYIDYLLSREKALLGENLVQVREQVRTDKENIRSALQWAIAHWEASEAAAALDSYTTFFLVQGWHEGREAYQDMMTYVQDSRPVDQVYYYARAAFAIFAVALSHLDEADEICQKDLPQLRQLDLPYELGMCLFTLGIIACGRGEYDQSRKLLLESKSLVGQCQKDFMVGEVLIWLGYVIYLQGDYAKAKAVFNESYQIKEKIQDFWGISFVLSKLGLVADALKDYSAARRYHEQGREILTKFGDLAGVGYTNSRMSLTAFGEGNYIEAIKFGRLGLEKFTEIGHIWGIGASNCRIGFAALELGDLEQAEICFQAALSHAKEFQHAQLSLYALAGIGNLLAMQGELERGVELIACVQAYPMTPAVYRELAERHLPEYEKILGSEAFEAAQLRGRELVLEQILQTFNLAEIAV